MKLSLNNVDVPNLSFEIRWNGGKKTPSFKLDVGASGIFDLDDYKISKGANCRLYARQGGTDLVYYPETTFSYAKGRSSAGEVIFLKDQFTDDHSIDGSRAA